MTDFIESGCDPRCMVGLLFALPPYAIGRRLEKEGRMLRSPMSSNWRSSAPATNAPPASIFTTARPRREILLDFKKVLQGVYDLDAYYSRVRR